MKKVFGLITICFILALPVLAVPLNFSINGKAMIEYSKGLAGPLPATDVKIVKKIPLPMEVGEIKGRPATPPGKEKNGGPAATGVLGATTTASKYAIVIGICDYPGTTNDICWSDGDSVNAYNALVNVYGYEPINIRLFRDMGKNPVVDGEKPATYEEISRAVEEIKSKAQEGDEVVFFFSGHGGDGIARDNDKETRDEAIIVHNGIDKLVYIWDGYLRDVLFAGFATTRIAFIFDSCLAGGMNDVAATGRVVSMATGETQVAYVYSKGKESEGELGEGVFSHYFVKEGMLNGEGNIHDYDKDGALKESNQVTVEEAFDYADGIIPSIWERQNPVISDKFAHDLLL